MKENFFNEIKGITTYEHIKSFADKEQLEMIEKQYKQGELYYYGTDDIKAIEERKDIIIFFENRCTDAATLMPFIRKLASLSEHINLHFCSANENEELLNRVIGEKKIPTVVVLDKNSSISGVYKEFPKVVNELIEENPDNREFIVKQEFRKGKYNLDIQKDIVKLILAK